MIIDCDTCVVRHQACDDCVVGVLLGLPEVPARSGDGASASGASGSGASGSGGSGAGASGASAVGEGAVGLDGVGAPREPAAPGAPLPVEFGPVERRALEVLADHGLIPRLRLVTAGPEPAGAERSSARRAPQQRRDAG